MIDRQPSSVQTCWGCVYCMHGGGGGSGRDGANYDKSNRFKYGTTVAGQTFNVVKLGN